MNYHYRNETFAPRFLLAIFLFFVAAMGATAIYAETERQRFDLVKIHVAPREYILLGDDTCITIIGGGRDALVHVSRDGLFE